MYLQTNFDCRWIGVSDDQTTNIGGQNGVLDHRKDLNTLLNVKK